MTLPPRFWTRTQKKFKRETLRSGRQAIANALVIAADPDFRWMADTFGQVMTAAWWAAR